jgi:plasmid stabilization system protein ParE
MKLVYSRRALADLAGIATYYSMNAGQAIAQSIERRFIEVTERIHHAPDSAPRVEQRAGIRVVSVIR